VARTQEHDGRRAEVRRRALELLLETETSGSFIDELFATHLRQLDAGPGDEGNRLGPRDRRLLQEIVYGSMRHQNTLDHLLRKHLRVPMVEQRAAERWALRLAAFQVVYLARIPPHAALHQTLEGLKALPGVRKKTVGFVNAVVRNLLQSIRTKTDSPPADPDDPSVLPVRQGFCQFHQPVLPPRGNAPEEQLALRYSYPPWLLKRWLGRYGPEEVRSLCERQNQTPQFTARVTQRAPSREEVLETLTAEGFEVSLGSFESAIVFQRGGALEASETFRRGWFQVQDETAMRIGSALAPPSGASVLDLCSGPGGKTSQLLEAIGPGGRLLATDRGERKLERVRETVQRTCGPQALEQMRTRLLPEAPRQVDLGETFSHVLVDAPCSNTGVLTRRPEARWRLRPRDLRNLSELQAELLEVGLRHLAPGGRILYSTCSIEPDENEEVIARVVEAHPEMTELATRLFLPHRSDGDGGYFSLLLKPR